MRQTLDNRRLSLLGAALIAVTGIAIVSVATATGGDTPQPPQGDALIDDINAGIAADPSKTADIGQVTRVKKGLFSTSAGDPVNVDLLAGKGDVRCLAVSGDMYSSSVGCFRQKYAAKDGSYQVVIPLIDSASPLVVGYAPNGKSRVKAAASGSSVEGAVRDHVFMTTLPPGILGENNAAQVTVEYQSQ